MDGYSKKVLFIRLQIVDTTLFEHTNIKFGMDLTKELDKNLANQHNFIQLCSVLAKSDIPDKHILKISLFDKIALPLTTIVLVLIGVPLAITPPRVRYNRGFLFSILILFLYFFFFVHFYKFNPFGFYFFSDYSTIFD